MSADHAMEPAAALTLLDAFADAYNRHDVDAIMALMTRDCVFLSYFGPDSCGERFEGFEPVKRRVAAGLAEFPDARWGDLNHFVSGNRGVSEWIFQGTRRATAERVERCGLDVFTFKDGKIHIKNTYHKWRQPQSLSPAEPRQEIPVPNIHRPIGRYAHAVRYRDLIFVSGCGPYDQDGRLVGAGDIVAQATRTMENVKAILESAGSSFAKVIKETVYLTNIDESGPTRGVRERYYGHTLPAATLIEVSRLAVPGMMIEIDIVAAV
jgi:reactive intermediate/imine deaminase